MSIVLVGSTSGSITLQEPAVAGSTVLDLPATSGTILTTGSSGQSIPKAALPTGSVLQVIQGFSSASFSTTSGSATDITGLTATITPTSSSSKILILSALQVSYDPSNAPYARFIIVRNGSTVYRGDAISSANRVSVGATLDGGLTTMNLFTASSNYLDSPATTSALTYKWQVSTYDSRTIYVNRTSSVADANASLASTSSIILMEIAA